MSPEQRARTYDDLAADGYDDQTIAEVLDRMERIEARGVAIVDNDDRDGDQ